MYPGKENQGCMMIQTFLSQETEPLKTDSNKRWMANSHSNCDFPKLASDKPIVVPIA